MTRLSFNVTHLSRYNKEDVDVFHEIIHATIIREICFTIKYIRFIKKFLNKFGNDIHVGNKNESRYQ